MRKHEQIKRLREEGYSFGEIADLTDSTTNYVRDVLHGKSATSYKAVGNVPWKCEECGGRVIGRRCRLCAIRREAKIGLTTMAGSARI